MIIFTILLLMLAILVVLGVIAFLSGTLLSILLWLLTRPVILFLGVLAIAVIIIILCI